MAATQLKNPAARIQGQMNFCSGWEWVCSHLSATTLSTCNSHTCLPLLCLCSIKGYWLNDVITARASWNPLMTAANRTSALATALSEITRVFGANAAKV
jgi:hypothetical protein